MNAWNLLQNDLAGRAQLVLWIFYEWDCVSRVCNIT